jgi:hypothetical protein
MTNPADHGTSTGAGAVRERPAFAATDARLAAVWDAVADPVRAELPGEGAARVARIVAAYRREATERRRFGALAPLPLRWAAACAPVVGLALGLAVTSRLEPAGGSPAQAVLVASLEEVSTALPAALPAPPPDQAAPAEPSSPDTAPAASIEETVEADGVEVAWDWDGWQPSLAELYLEDLGLDGELAANEAEPAGEGLL